MATRHAPIIPFAFRTPSPRSRFKALVPACAWLPTYPKQWLAADAVAGLTLAAFAIPVGLAVHMGEAMPVLDQARLDGRFRAAGQGIERGAGRA